MFKFVHVSSDPGHINLGFDIPKTNHVFSLFSLPSSPFCPSLQPRVLTHQFIYHVFNPTTCSSNHVGINRRRFLDEPRKFLPTREPPSFGHEFRHDRLSRRTSTSVEPESKISTHFDRRHGNHVTIHDRRRRLHIDGWNSG